MAYLYDAALAEIKQNYSCMRTSVQAKFIILRDTMHIHKSNNYNILFYSYSLHLSRYPCSSAPVFPDSCRPFLRQVEI